MIDATTHIGVLTVRLFMNGPQSLKEKRTILKSLKDRVHKEFNVSIAELDDQDKWQVATLGVCMISGDQRYIDGALQNILSFMERDPRVVIAEQKIEFF